MFFPDAAVLRVHITYIYMYIYIYTYIYNIFFYFINSFIVENFNLI